MTPRISPHVLDATTDAQLRALDAAPTPSTADRVKAQATLEAILSADRATPVDITVPRSTRARHLGRWTAAAAATLLVGGGALAVQTATAPAASASWTAVPSEVSAADLTLAQSACRDRAAGAGGASGWDWLDPTRLAVRLAERRGDWIALLLTGPGKAPLQTPEASVSCLVELPPGASSTGDVEYAAGGGGGFRAPQGAEFYEGAMSQFALGAGPLDDGEPVSFVDGRIGPDVAKLTIHSQGKTVEASVKDGTYAAWWPGRAFPDEPLPPSGQGGPRPTLTYDLTLTDGTVLTHVAPTRPSS